MLDKTRLINGQIFDEDYFGHLISEIQEIRASECRFYQKITDIYANAVDYTLESTIIRDFFATVQNKMHYAVHGNTAVELQELNEIVTMYLDYATRQARRHIPMTMADWSNKLDAFLQFNDAEVLQDKGKVTAAIAKAFAESEFEQYRVLQDKKYISDFDRLMMEAESTNKDNRT